MKIKHGVMRGGSDGCSGVCDARAQVTVKHLQLDEEVSGIATGVWAGDTFYLSGQRWPRRRVTPGRCGEGDSRRLWRYQEACRRSAR